MVDMLVTLHLFCKSIIILVGCVFVMSCDCLHGMENNDMNLHLLLQDNNIKNL